ncbi:MAG: alkaline phosphatase family protein [Acidobacteriota bacterium]
MRSRRSGTCFLSLLLLIGVVPADAGPRKSLVVAIDGLRADGLIALDTPNIDRLIDGTLAPGYRGAFAYEAQTIQDAPTSSAYNHCSIMTGVTGTQHGVDGNNAAALAAVDYDAFPHYLTTLEQADPTLGTVYLVTWGPDTSIVSGADYVKDGDDEANTERAVAILEGAFEDPAGDDGTAWTMGAEVDAIFLFLDDVDGSGHGFGFDVRIPGYADAVARADAQVGRVLDAIVGRPSFADEVWQVVIVSDHGGLGLNHGGLTPNEETIPSVVCSPEVMAGYMVGDVRNMDAAPTAIAHVLGAAAVPVHHSGRPRGLEVREPAPLDLSTDLVLHLGFDGDYRDGSGRGNDAAIGPESDVDPILHPTGGACDGYVEITNPGGGVAGASYLTLGTPADLELGADGDFTLAVWMRASVDQVGDPVIFGNKNWASGLNPGVLLLANEGNGDDFGANIADGTLRRDVEALDYGLDAWWLLVLSVDRDDTAVLFVGGPDGIVQVLADFTSDLGDLSSGLPWNIGQDGTGEYPVNLGADLDDLRVWRRSLDLDEVRRLHADGAGTCSRRLLRNTELTTTSPPTPPLASVLPLDVTDDFYRTVLPSLAFVPAVPSPLVFYSLDGPGELRIEKTDGGELRISF